MRNAADFNYTDGTMTLRALTCRTLGWLAFSVGAAGICDAQEAPDPFAISPATKPAVADDAFAEAKRLEAEAPHRVDPRITLLTEFIEITQNDWSRLARDPESDTEGPDLRKRLTEWLKTGGATLIDMSLVSGISGDSLLNRSFRFHIYPSEFEPPRIDEKNGRIVPASFTAAECWAAGCGIQGEATLSGDGRVNLDLVPEIVEMTGDGATGKAEGEVPLPGFQIQKIYSHLDVAAGESVLAGVMQSHTQGSEDSVLLVFMRADVHQSESAPFPLK